MVVAVLSFLALVTTVHFSQASMDNWPQIMLWVWTPLIFILWIVTMFQRCPNCGKFFFAKGVPLKPFWFWEWN